MKLILTAIITFLAPNRIAIYLLNLLGHRIHPQAYIGFSIVKADAIEMQAGSRIGQLNLIRIPRIVLGESASIRNFNRMKGSFSLLMNKDAAIGNSNNIARGPFPITSGDAHLRLGQLAIITSKHDFDCTCSIEIGDFSTISGFRCQFWTHGFYHAEKGPKRIRIDGPISIGNNVSIGSGCMINPGVSIGDAINVGGNTSVAKSISQPGMYVSQGLRYIPNSMEAIIKRLPRNRENKYVDVYQK